MIVTKHGRYKTEYKFVCHKCGCEFVCKEWELHDKQVVHRCSGIVTKGISLCPECFEQNIETYCEITIYK